MAVVLSSRARPRRGPETGTEAFESPAGCEHSMPRDGKLPRNTHTSRSRAPIVAAISSARAWSSISTRTEVMAYLLRRALTLRWLLEAASVIPCRGGALFLGMELEVEEGQPGGGPAENWLSVMGPSRLSSPVDGAASDDDSRKYRSSRIQEKKPKPTRPSGYPRFSSFLNHCVVHGGEGYGRKTTPWLSFRASFCLPSVGVTTIARANQIRPPAASADRYVDRGAARGELRRDPPGRVGQGGRRAQGLCEEISRRACRARSGAGRGYAYGLPGSEFPVQSSFLAPVLMVVGSECARTYPGLFTVFPVLSGTSRSSAE